MKSYITDRRTTIQELNEVQDALNLARRNARAAWHNRNQDPDTWQTAGATLKECREAFEGALEFYHPAPQR